MVVSDGTRPPLNHRKEQERDDLLSILQLIAKYGKRAIDWCWANKDRILNWIRNGMAIDWIINKIKEILGIR